MSDMPEDIKARRNAFRIWGFIGGLIILGVLGWLMGVLSMPIGIVVWAAIIIFCLRGPVAWFEKKGINRALGTGIAYLLMFIVLILLGLLLFSPAYGIGDQFASLISAIPGYITNVVDLANQIYADNKHLFTNETVMSILNDSLNSLSAMASDMAQTSIESIFNIGGAIGGIAMIVGFAFVVAYWVLMELPAMGREVYRLANPKRHEVIRMWHLTFTRVLGGYIRATLLQCALIGFASAIAYLIIGIPNFAALGAITGLMNIIPIIGPWIGGALAGLATVFVDPTQALIAVIATIAIQQIIYTFVSPKLMSDSVDVHPAIVILAMMAGSAIGTTMSGLVGGLVGMLASIPFAAVSKSLFVYYYEKKTGRRIVSKDGVFFRGEVDKNVEGYLDPINDMLLSVYQKKDKKLKENEDLGE